MFKLAFTKDNVDIYIKPNISGIYFLFDEKDRVQYIGKSADLRQRLFAHIGGNSHIKTDLTSIKSFSFSKVDAEVLEKIEALMIENIKPFKNKQSGNRNRKYRGFYFDADILAVLDAYEGNKSDLMNELLREVFIEKGLL